MVWVLCFVIWVLDYSQQFGDILNFSVLPNLLVDTWFSETWKGCVMQSAQTLGLCLVGEKSWHVVSSSYLEPEHGTLDFESPHSQDKRKHTYSLIASSEHLLTTLSLLQLKLLGEGFLFSISPVLRTEPGTYSHPKNSVRTFEWTMTKRPASKKAYSGVQWAISSSKKIISTTNPHDLGQVD